MDNCSDTSSKCTSKQQDNQTFSMPHKIGGALGIAFGVFLIILVWFLLCNRRRRREAEAVTAEGQPPAYYGTAVELPKPKSRAKSSVPNVQIKELGIQDLEWGV
jgi:hypothetical protein